MAELWIFMVRGLAHHSAFIHLTVFYTYRTVYVACASVRFLQVL